MSTPEKFEKLQQALVDAPEYFGLAEAQRVACKRFLALAGTDADPDEIEAAYVAAVAEAKGLVAKGVLTGIDLEDVEQVKTGTNAEEEPQEGKPVEKVVALQPVATDTIAEKVEPFPEYEFHPIAAIFPMMEDGALSALADNIKEDGLNKDILLFEGKVADGRHRYLGCKKSGVAPRFVTWTGSEAALIRHVVSDNLHRRHLSDAQRAMIGAKLKAIFEPEAKKRRNANLAQNKGPTVPANLPERGESRENVAEALNVSGRAVEKAAHILKQGDASLIEAASEGKVSLDAAQRVSKLPIKEQQAIVEAGKVKEAAAEIRRKKAEAKAKAEKKKADEAKAKAAQAKAEAEEKERAEKARAEAEEKAKAEKAAIEAEEKAKADAAKDAERTPAPPAPKPAPPAQPYQVALAALPEARREAAKKFIHETLVFITKLPSATPEDADLAIGGIVVLLRRARDFLKGKDDGGFLREATGEPASNGGEVKVNYALP